MKIDLKIWILVLWILCSAVKNWGLCLHILPYKNGIWSNYSKFHYLKYQREVWDRLDFVGADISKKSKSIRKFLEFVSMKYISIKYTWKIFRYFGRKLYCRFAKMKFSWILLTILYTFILRYTPLLRLIHVFQLLTCDEIWYITNMTYHSLRATYKNRFIKVKMIFNTLN